MGSGFESQGIHLTNSANWCMIVFTKENAMNRYDYDYHDLADAYFIEEESNDSGTDEIMETKGWDHYYHNLASEIIDD